MSEKTNRCNSLMTCCIRGISLLRLAVMLFVIVLLSGMDLLAQQDSFEVIPGRRDTLYGSAENVFTSIPAPRHFLENAARSGSSPTSINGTISGASPAEEVAILYAFDIWASSIYSPVAIDVSVSFATLGGGALASAGPNLLYRNFPGSPQTNTFYPSALVNSIVGCDLAPLDVDINITIDNTTSWYTGTDANPGAGQYDLVTVVLHELGHGLGYVGSANIDDGAGVNECNGVANNGCVGLQSASPSDPFSYDLFVENGSASAITSFTNPSVALAFQLTNNDLYWNGANAVSANLGVNPRIYAPGTFSSGSSFSHLDESTYPAGNAHSLMTPTLAAAEAIHSIGGITLGMMQDMGWTLITAAFAEFDVRTVGYTGQNLLFRDCSAMSTSWAWDFENDAITDATSQNPLHSYSSAGTYTARLTINGNPALTKTVTIDIFDPPTLPYLEDFDADGGGFYADAPGCLSWEWGAGLTKANFNGVNATINGAGNWMTGISGTHGTNTIYYLESPPFNFTSVTGDILVEFDFRAICASDAGLNMEYSTDGGISWNLLGFIGDPNIVTSWYNQASLAGLGGQEGWSQISLATTHPIYRATAFSGLSDVRFRFVFGANATGGLDGFQIDNFSVTSSVLTARLLDFSVQKNGSKSHILWTADRQIDDVEFVLERAADPTNFEVLAIIKASDGFERKQYEFLDSNPYPGDNFYRLSLTDINGNTHYSEVERLVFSSHLGVRVYPNPASENLFVDIPSESSAESRFRLYSLSGKLLMEKNLQVSTSNELDLSALEPGIYLYEIPGAGPGSRGKIIRK